MGDSPPGREHGDMWLQITQRVLLTTIRVPLMMKY